jgi:hypothetical protein
MNRRAILLTPLALLGVQKHSYRFDRQFNVQPQVVDIEIPNGAITLRASNTNQIRVAADIELSSPTAEDLELAKHEVRFEPRLEGNTFRIWTEAPEQRRSQRYSYRHNAEIDIPASARLILRGVNGKIDVTYTAAPTKDIYVRNINGEIQLQFPPQLNADFQMKTMNGNIYTAFEMSALPSKSETEVTERGMKRIVSRNRFAGGRVGRGGIEVQIEGLNGDIRIVEKKG